MFVNPTYTQRLGEATANALGGSTEWQAKRKQKTNPSFVSCEPCEADEGYETLPV
jgi:hypothetical protein